MSILGEEISLTYWGENYQIGEIKVDAMIKENHELRAEVTDHPTESGESFVDHVYTMPLTLTLEGIISNTPMALVGFTLINTIENLREKKSNDRAQLAYALLESIFTARKPLTITTSLKTYDHMVLQSLSIDRNAHTSASLHFRATAKQVRLVNLALIKIPTPKVERVKPQQNRGHKETKTPSPTIKTEIKKRSSFLQEITNWFGS